MTAMIREMVEGDLPAAHGLSMAVRWPHRLEDWRFALSQGAGVTAERDGTVLGTAMGWCFGAGQATFGLLIVSPEAQGQGLGRRLMEAALAGLGARAISLHATPEGEGLYRRLGFVALGSVQQHQGVVRGGGGGAGGEVRAAGAALLPVVAALDAGACGMDRRGLLAAAMAEAECAVLSRGGEVCGFAMLRPFGRGEVLGPVVAPDGAGARELIGHLLARRAGRFVRIDVPEAAGLGGFLEEAGLVPVDTVTRMVRGTPPAGAGVWALVSQAFG